MDLKCIKWQQKVVSALDVARSLRKPIIAKLDNSNYGKYDVANNKGTSDVFLLHSRHNSTRVTAANVKWNGERYSDTGHSLAVPLAYTGWFEILPLHQNSFLGDEKRSGEPYFTISTICEAKVTSFLSAQDIMCFQLPASDLMGVYLKEIFPAGEVFVVQGIYVETLKKPSLITSCLKGSASDISYLQCQSTFGRDVLIPLESKGIFWPLGVPGEMQTGCVYQMQHIVDSLRDYPGLHVRLIHGDAPPSLPSKQFNKVMRLEEVVKQEVIVACILGEINPLLLEFPLYSSVSFMIAEPDSVKHFIEIVEYVGEKLDDYLSNIKVVKTIQFGAEKFPAVNRKNSPAPGASNASSKGGPSWSENEYKEHSIRDGILKQDGNNSDVFVETARRLRQDLASRKLDGQNSDEGYLSASAACQRKLSQKESKEMKGHKTFQGMRELKGKDSHKTKKQVLGDRYRIRDYNDETIDCDILSTSTSSGAVMVATDKEDAKSDISGSRKYDNDEESSIDMLYKRISSNPNIKRVPSNAAPRPHYYSYSNLNPHREVLATDSEISQLTSDSWIPPKSVNTMSVEDVGRSMTYIGMKPGIVKRFMEEQIDGHQLKGLEEELLKEGFPEMNALDRKKVLDFKGGWRPKREAFV